MIELSSENSKFEKSNLNEEMAFYDKINANYASYTDESQISDFYLALRDLVPLIERFQTTSTSGISSMRMLEHGCGTGRPTRHLKKQGKVREIYGCDINDQMLAHARNFDPQGIYIKMDDERLTIFNDNQFDVIISCMVVLVIHSKEIIQSIFNEVERTLKPGGLFIVINTSIEMYSDKREWLFTKAGHFAENHHITSGSRIKNQVKGTNLIFEDYYWSDKDIQEMATQAHLDLEYIYNPLGTESDGVQWLDEKSISPFQIYIIRKPTKK